MFSSDKVLQEIGYLLLLNDNRMNLLKLMKELYLIDREAIKDTNFSVSGDNHCSMDNGPVLSTTLNLLYDLGKGGNNIWNEYFLSKETRYYPDICLKNKTNDDELSEMDKEYIKNISDKFKNYDEWELKDYTHNLKEWKNPKGSSVPIKYKDIMLAVGKTEKEIVIAKREYEALSELYNLQ